MSAAERAQASSVICLLAVLMAFQGGFFPRAATCILAGYALIAAALAAWRMSKRQSLIWQSARIRSVLSARYFAPCACALLIALLMALSIVAHGMDATAFLECSPWVMAALAACMAGTLSDRGRIWLLRGIAWLGVVSAIVGILLFAGLPRIGGTVNAGRLQFLFQYANAAGAWFAAAVLLCWRSQDTRLERCALLPLTALLLTQSIGSLLLCILIVVGSIIVGSMHMDRKEATVKDASLLFQVLFAALAFACLRIDAGLGMLVFMVAAAAFYELWPKVAKRIVREGRGSLVLFVSAALCIAAALAFMTFMAPRITQAAGTMMERVVQIGDASYLLLREPLLGIGPDQWQHVYPAIQSADYRAAVVHCGYLQLGLDAGVVAPIASLGMIALAMKGYGFERYAILFLGLHSFVDFDLAFAFFPVLICILCASRLAPVDQLKPRVRAGS